MPRGEAREREGKRGEAPRGAKSAAAQPANVTAANVAYDIQYENRPKVTAVPVQLTEKCMVLVLAMYGGARRMHALHASALR